MTGQHLTDVSVVADVGAWSPRPAIEAAGSPFIFPSPPPPPSPHLFLHRFLPLVLIHSPPATVSASSPRPVPVTVSFASVDGRFLQPSSPVLYRRQCGRASAWSPRPARAIEAAGLPFILGARIPYIPQVIATGRHEHPGHDDRLGGMLRQGRRGVKPSNARNSLSSSSVSTRAGPRRPRNRTAGASRRPDGPHTAFVATPTVTGSSWSSGHRGTRTGSPSRLPSLTARTVREATR